MNGGGAPEVRAERAHQCVVGGSQHRGADGDNAQLAVDDAAQVVVAHGVTNQPADCRNLEPVIERAKENVGEAPANATADAGCWNPEVEARARALGTEAWVATARKPAEAPSDAGATAHDEASPRERMRARVASEDGRALYARRKAVVEPVGRRHRDGDGPTTNSSLTAASMLAASSQYVAK